MATSKMVIGTCGRRVGAQTTDKQEGETIFHDVKLNFVNFWYLSSYLRDNFHSKALCTAATSVGLLS